MKAALTRNQDSLDPVSDGDGGGGVGVGVGGGNSQRAALGYVENVKKILDLLEQIVIPSIVDTVQKPAANKAASGSPVDHLPKALRLLQRHSAITSNTDDGGQITTNQKPNPQSDDN